MAKLSLDRSIGTLHPREDIFSTGVIGAAGAEIIIPADGASTVSVDLRGTFSLTLEVAGTVDGFNWSPIPVRPINQAAIAYVAAITGTAQGVWVGKCAPFKSIRIRCTAWTSGSATTTILASNAVLDDSLQGMVTTLTPTAVGAAGAAVTLTIPNPGAGLRVYLTYLSINRFATALLAVGATPVTVTTTNLPSSVAFSFPADAAAAGTIDRWREDFAYPIASVAQAAATTIVCPATTNVIWRITAGYYIAP